MSEDKIIRQDPSQSSTSGPSQPVPEQQSSQSKTIDDIPFDDKLIRKRTTLLSDDLLRRIVRLTTPQSSEGGAVKNDQTPQ
jgi:hypothetical protein